ncbi:MBL fold metallo-hydrolase [Clostridium fermenticellae]|uniref:MBL fold metallo-hydrolase n=1 Tax=Clostridium fermenticellae TaxID=2068654 RepID=A0A386H0H3_9CLOT|nr:MBL fold metallo-hydrolase [Clostridium fermenticellae]AYD39140.1 MBL fold metallo-hydrolase [Clostridium fermenticellae]
MIIKWLGHSSFLLEDSNGRKILTDPFDETVGYECCNEKVDIVSISHHHFDHDYVDNLKYDNIIDKPGSFNLCNIKITGLQSYHDKVKGAKRGENTIFIFEMDGYRICHLGDLGYILSSDEINKLGNIDVLLIPIGGNYTIDGHEASELAKLVKSHILIPMHYKTPLLSFKLDGLENFLLYMKNGERVNSNTLVLNGPLSGINIVKILNYK